MADFRFRICNELLEEEDGERIWCHTSSDHIKNLLEEEIDDE